MSEVDEALQRIAVGTGAVFFGGIMGTLLEFLSKALIARYFERNEYGTFALALTLLNAGLLIALLGFAEGLPREISRYKNNAPEKVYDLVLTAFIIIILTSSGVMVSYFLLIPRISIILHDNLLPYALVAVSPALPFASILLLLVSISRGFGRVKEKVYYQHLLVQIVYFTVVVVIVFGNLGFISIFIGYTITQAVSSLLLFSKMRRLGLLKLRSSFNSLFAREIVFFSVPLMFTGILEYIMSWTDTLMLGYYYRPSVVGIYNTAAPLARFIPAFLGSAGFLFMPTATLFYLHGKIGELRRIYQMITRWIFLPTFPLFLLLFLFPDVTIKALFGSKYTPASPALEVLAIGFMVHTLFGLNGMSLVAIGKPNAVMISNIISATVNVLLNMFLIPSYGIEGAAMATAASYLTANILRSGWLYRNIHVHPFGRKYIKQLSVAGGITFTAKLANIQVPNLWDALLIVAALFGFYLILILILKTVDSEDLTMLDIAGKRLRVNLCFLIKFLEGFK